VPTVVFYISGHGFGHASRDVEVINVLGRGRPDLRLILRSAVSPDLLARTITAPYELRPGPSDTGIVQSSSVAHDDPATIARAVAFHRRRTAWVDAEVTALRHDDVRLVFGDIPPLAFDVAARLGVPSVAMANFTWDWIYETHPGFQEAAPDVIADMRASYARASLALELPFSGGFGVFRRVEPVPLVARRATRGRAETRAHFGLPPARRVALLSFGGYGLPALDLTTIDCLDTWTIVTTDRVSPDATGLPASVVAIAEHQFLSNGFRYEDLVAASDVVVTKPGFGIIAECISAGTAMLYTSRGRFREYDVLVEALPRYVRSRFIPQDDLFEGRWREALTILDAQPPPPDRLATNGAEIAAGWLIETLSAG